MQWKIRDLVRTHLLPMEHNASDNDHDEHQKHRKKATSDELHAVFSEFPTVRLWISSPPNFLGQCDDVWVPSFLRIAWSCQNSGDPNKARRRLRLRKSSRSDPLPSAATLPELNCARNSPEEGSPFRDQSMASPLSLLP